MDDRQQQIQVGAGLQESRLNTDLINFLEKWGTWILTIILVIVASYVGWSKFGEYKATRHDEAFDQYVSARGTPGTDGVYIGSPDNLLRIATEHSSSGAIAHLARLDAAEIYLGSARRGLRPGTDLAAVKPEDALSADETNAMLRQAGSLFEQVAADTASKKQQTVLNLRARWGIFAVALSAGDVDRARRMLAEIESAAGRAGLAEQAAEAKKRAAQLDLLSAPQVLLSDADLPAVAAAPVQQPGSNINIFNPDNVQLQQMPEGFVPPGFQGSPGTPIVEPEPPARPFIIPPQEGQPQQPPPSEPRQPGP